MKSLKEQADPNCEVCKGTGQDTMTTGFTCVCDCVKEPSRGLIEEDKAEIEREAEVWIKQNNYFPEVPIENCSGPVDHEQRNELQRHKRNCIKRGYIDGVFAERSRLSSLLFHSEQKYKESVRLLELAGNRVKELETELFSKQSMQEE